jgi:hypothetical protein
MMSSFHDDSDKENQSPNTIQSSLKESSKNNCPAQAPSLLEIAAVREANDRNNAEIQRPPENNEPSDEYHAEVSSNSSISTTHVVHQEESEDIHENDHQPVHDGANTDNLNEQDAPK